MSEKIILKAGNELKTVQYAELHKYNQTTRKSTKTGTCAYCFESVVFRVVLINKVNQLICTRCLKSARLYKTTRLSNNRMFYKKSKLTVKDKLKRTIYRIVGYFKGNHVFYPFKIKRRSELGQRITKVIIKFKGLNDA